MVNGIEKVSMRKLARTIKILMQTGKREDLDVERDRGRAAKLPGKRISKTGNIYWETRLNRSDNALKRI